MGASNAQRSRPDLERELDRVRKDAATGRYAEALERLAKLHVDVHDEALPHLRVHLEWFGQGLRHYDFWTAASQIAPIYFAVPVSLVHKYTGLSLFKRRDDAAH